MRSSASASTSSAGAGIGNSGTGPAYPSGGRALNVTPRRSDIPEPGTGAGPDLARAPPEPITISSFTLASHQPSSQARIARTRTPGRTPQTPRLETLNPPHLFPASPAVQRPFWPGGLPWGVLGVVCLVSAVCSVAVLVFGACPGCSVVGVAEVPGLSWGDWFAAFGAGGGVSRLDAFVPVLAELVVCVVVAALLACASCFVVCVLAGGAASFWWGGEVWAAGCWADSFGHGVAGVCLVAGAGFEPAVSRLWVW